MEEVVLVIHLILALAIIGLVLLQRSEGGGLGIGNSGGIGNIASAKGTANALSRMTAICATCFFITSLALGILAAQKTSGTEGLLSTYEETTEAPTDEIEGELSAPVEGASPEVEIEFKPGTSTPADNQEESTAETPVEAPVATPSDTSEEELEPTPVPVEDTEPQAGEEKPEIEAPLEEKPEAADQEQIQEPDTKTDSTD